MGLFWYPEINCKYDFDKPDKQEMLNDLIRYYLDRLQSMFIYENLPDSIPAKWLENYLFCNGLVGFIKDGDDLIVTNGGIGDEPNVYYIPTKFIVSNPYLKDEKAARTYTIGEDCAIVYNDIYAVGMLPMLKLYCSQLVENHITMNIADIIARASIVLSAADDKTKASAEEWLRQLRNGNPGIIGEAPFLIGNNDKSLHIDHFREVASTLTDLIEYHQYLKASLYNEMGLDSNYNMKRESINSNESQLNDDMLHPLIDTMLKCREDGLKEVNRIFGTNITVRFNSAWAINEREEQASIENIEAPAEAITEEAPAEASTEEAPAEASTEEAPAEASTEETPAEASTEETPVEVTITEDAINEIAEAVAEKIEEGEENA